MRRHTISDSSLVYSSCCCPGSCCGWCRMWMVWMHPYRMQGQCLASGMPRIPLNLHERPCTKCCCSSHMSPAALLHKCCFYHQALRMTCVPRPGWQCLQGFQCSAMSTPLSAATTPRLNTACTDSGAIQPAGGFVMMGGIWLVSVLLPAAAQAGSTRNEAHPPSLQKRWPCCHI